MRKLAFVTVMLGIVAGLVPAAADDPPIGATSVFARVPEPGMPEGIAVRDGIVYVGTHVSVRGNAGGPPSKIFTYSLETGEPLEQTYTIEGQNTAATHGILGMAFDADGRLYILDRGQPSRVLRLDVATGEQETYAIVPETTACRPTGPTTDCAPVTVDEPSFPDYLAFAPDGRLLITDLQAATLFVVDPHEVVAGEEPPTARVWFQDARLDGIFGPNGIALSADGEEVYFAQTASTQPATYARGMIYRLPLVDAPTAEDLTEVFTYLDPSTGPDGIAFGDSGRLYVALAGTSQMSILEEGDDGTWTEQVRFPDLVSNQLQEVPYDLPASIAFDEEGNILVTNQSFWTGTESHWVVLRAFVDDVAQPLFEPDLP